MKAIVYDFDSTCFCTTTGALDENNCCVVCGKQWIVKPAHTPCAINCDVHPACAAD